MLRIIASTDSEQAKSYYTKGLAREDYYNEEQEIRGLWGGLGAARLKLKGEVGRKEFLALCDNLDPRAGRPLTPRTKSHRRVGYDFNFHCPKSLSVMHALTGDNRLMDIFRQSVKETMEELEREMKTRVRTEGRQFDRTTGNLVWGEFFHLTARPVEGIPDPHLHAHCFVFNATWDEVEGRWKAGQFGDIKRDAYYYEAAFHARLSKRVSELGYSVERTAQGWEISGVPLSVIRTFSRRTAEIEMLAEERGIVSAAALDKLGAATRENKRKGLTNRKLLEDWESRLTPKEKRAVEEVKEAAKRQGGKGVERRDGEAALLLGGRLSDLLELSLAHNLERSSVAPEKRLLAEALRRGYGEATPEPIKRELLGRSAKGSLIRKEWEGQILCTTPEVLREEAQLFERVRRSRNRCRPLWRSKEPYPIKNTRLNEEQRGAVRHLLTSTDRYIALRGAAGVGKTTLMKEAVAAIEEVQVNRTGGKRVFAFAPSADAARQVLRSEGFRCGETVARLLCDPAIQQEIRQQVIWIDEAGLLGARTMNEVMALAQRSDARVILTGDSRQHRGVERGDALRLLERQAGLHTFHLKSIQRQRGEYKKAVAELSEGKAAEGFKRLEEMGAIREHGEEERYRAVARDYVESVQKGKTALIVSPTHAEGEEVNRLVRENLRKSGIIEREESERSCRALKGVSWTETERGEAENYEPGQWVEFHQNVPGISKGERLRVAEVIAASDDANKRRVLLERKGAKHQAERQAETQMELPLDQAGRFQVYQERSIPVAPGDQLRFTKNARTLPDEKIGHKPHRLNNGSIYRVKEFTEEGHLRLDNGWVVDREHGHFTHGYCVTSHASQGKTVDHVLIAQSADSYIASSQEQFYVSASRAREQVSVYTDSREDLLRAVQRSEARLSASELVGSGNDPDSAEKGDREGRERREGMSRLFQMFQRRQRVGQSEELGHHVSPGVSPNVSEEQKRSPLVTGVETGLQSGREDLRDIQPHAGQDKHADPTQHGQQRGPKHGTQRGLGRE